MKLYTKTINFFSLWNPVFSIQIFRWMWHYQFTLNSLIPLTSTNLEKWMVSFEVSASKIFKIWILLLPQN